MIDKPSIYDDENDGELEKIKINAEEAAIHAWGPISNLQHQACPYKSGTEEYEYWWNCFNRTYAKLNN